MGKHGTMAEAAGEVPVWMDTHDSDGVPLWREFRACREEYCEEPDCEGECEPWYDSGPTIWHGRTSAVGLRSSGPIRHNRSPTRKPMQHRTGEGPQS